MAGARGAPALTEPNMYMLTGADWTFHDMGFLLWPCCILHFFFFGVHGRSSAFVESAEDIRPRTRTGWDLKPSVAEFSEIGNQRRRGVLVYMRLSIRNVNSDTENAELLPSWHIIGPSHVRSSLYLPVNPRKRDQTSLGISRHACDFPTPARDVNCSPWRHFLA